MPGFQIDQLGVKEAHKLLYLGKCGNCLFCQLVVDRMDHLPEIPKFNETLKVRQRQREEVEGGLRYIPEQHLL